MRKLFVAAALVCLGLPASAQDVPRVEIFGGYSFLRSGDEDLNGWALALSYNLTPRFGIVLDESGHYGKSQGVSLRHSEVAVGPGAAFRGERASVFVHAVAGLIRTVGAIEVAPGVRISQSENDFGMLFGGGVDIKASKKLAVRLAGGYELIRSDRDFEKAYRASAGVVLRIGRK